MLAEFLNGGGKNAVGMEDIPSGKRPVDCPNEYERWEYLQAGSGSQWKPAKGTRTTRFHNGFQRRQQSAIGQDRSRLEHLESRATRQAAIADLRREHLRTRDKQNGFHVLTGKSLSDGHMAPAPHHHQRKHFDENKVSDFVAREGDMLLRTSASRFHRPERVTTVKRTERIRTEGLGSTVKYSSLLGLGRSDLRSYGVADNFSKSLYDVSLRPPSEGALLQRGEAPPRHTQSAGGPGGVLGATARSMMSTKPRRDPELHNGRGRSSRGGGSARDRGLASAGSMRSGSMYSARSRGSRGSMGSRRSKARSQRAADIDFVRALPE